MINNKQCLYTGLLTILILCIFFYIPNTNGYTAFAATLNDPLYTTKMIELSHPEHTLEKLVVSPLNCELTVNDAYAVGAIAYYSDDHPNVFSLVAGLCTFSSSNSSVAYATTGSYLNLHCEAYIQAVGEGNATITVSFGDKNVDIAVTVKNNRSTIQRIITGGGIRTTLSPPFQKDITEYNLILPKDCTVIPKVQLHRVDIYGIYVYFGGGGNDINLIAEVDYNPIVEVKDADSVLGTTEIKVTSADGSESKVYKIHNIYETSLDNRYNLGNIVFNKNQSKLTAMVYIGNFDNNFDINNATLLLAQYDKNGLLKDLKRSTISLYYGNEKWLTSPEISLEDGYHYKAFVWEDIQSKKPLTEAAYYQ